MPIYLQYSGIEGIPQTIDEGPLHGLKLGPKTLTPRNIAMEIQAWSFSVISPRDAASGMPSGKRQHSPLLVITKQTDINSPLLFQRCAAGNQLFAKLKINFLATHGKGNNPPQVYHTIDLTNASVVNYRRFLGQPAKSATHARSYELEEFGLVFQKITYANVTKSKSTSDDWLAGA